MTPDRPPLIAKVFWITAPKTTEIREEALSAPGPDGLLVRALYGAISRGTESLVFNGRVPRSEWQRMRCPFQRGDFPAPVSYGYISVGRVEEGPGELAGRMVFCLHPHQDLYTVPASAAVPVPKSVPAARAVLAANMETALNVVWDAEIADGMLVTVVGGGVVGSLVAYLAQTLAGTAVEVVDPDAAKRPIHEALNLRSVDVGGAKDERDVVIHASATADGLNLALELARTEGSVVEASWYGDAAVPVALGGPFHARRLRLISSQVGMVAPMKRDEVTHAARMAQAMALLDDPRLDALITHEVGFDALPAQLPELLSASTGVGCIRIRYQNNENTMGA